MLRSGSHGHEGCRASTWQHASCYEQWHLYEGRESGPGLCCVVQAPHNHTRSGSGRASLCALAVSKFLLDLFAAAFSCKIWCEVGGTVCSSGLCYICNKVPVLNQDVKRLFNRSASVRGQDSPWQCCNSSPSASELCWPK
jgi:hypothetical protein